MGYSQAEFIRQAKLGSAILVTLDTGTASASFAIRDIFVTVSTAFPTYDLGKLFFPKDVLHAEDLKWLVKKGMLIATAGTVRLDYPDKYINFSSSSSFSSCSSSCSSCSSSCCSSSSCSSSSSRSSSSSSSCSSSSSYSSSSSSCSSSSSSASSSAPAGPDRGAYEYSAG